MHHRFTLHCVRKGYAQPGDPFYASLSDEDRKKGHDQRVVIQLVSTIAPNQIVRTRAAIALIEPDMCVAARYKEAVDLVIVTPEPGVEAPFECRYTGPARNGDGRVIPGEHVAIFRSRLGEVVEVTSLDDGLVCAVQVGDVYDVLLEPVLTTQERNAREAVQAMVQPEKADPATSQVW